MATRWPVLALVLGLPLSAGACEPIVPFVKAIGGTGVVTVSLAVLALVVLLKSLAFARFQNRITFSKALLWMLAANVVTSIIGITVPAMIDSGAAMFIGLPLLWAACLLPAQRLIAAAPLNPFSRYTPGQLAFGMTLALAFSCVLLVMSRAVHDADTFFRFWFFKLPLIYLALLVGLVLTAFWEEWIVLRLSRCEDHDLDFVRPVIRANVVVLAAVMLVSLAVVIPKRFNNSPLAVRATATQPSTLPAR